MPESAILKDRKNAMSDTQPIETGTGENLPSNNRRKVNKWQIIGLVAIGLALVLVSVWFTWLKPFIQKPISDPLNLPSVSTDLIPTATEAPTDEPTLTPTAPEATPTPSQPPVCGEGRTFV